MKADDWTSPTTVFCLKHGHDGEVTDMQRTTYSARCASRRAVGAFPRCRFPGAREGLPGMTDQTGGDQPQKTVAELLAQHGAQAEGGRRRRLSRRR